MLWTYKQVTQMYIYMIALSEVNVQEMCEGKRQNYMRKKQQEIFLNKDLMRSDLHFCKTDIAE